MPLPWPTNTATPPPGWDVVTDADGTNPMGWFTKADRGMRAVVRAYPAWDDAPFHIPAEARQPAPLDRLDRLGLHLRGVFDVYERGYLFPDVDISTGPHTHTFTNLDFVRGWTTAIGWTRAERVLLERTIAGAKPAAQVTVKDSDVKAWTSEALAAGLGMTCINRGQWNALWFAPSTLADRVDRNALTDAWHMLSAADPDHQRGTTLRDRAEQGLDRAFSLDLMQTMDIDDPRPQPWWDEYTDVGLVVLGAVLGYPPASTYGLLAEIYGPTPIPSLR